VGEYCRDATALRPLPLIHATALRFMLTSSFPHLVDMPPRYWSHRTLWQRCAPDPCRSPHTRKGASDYPVPRRSCSVRFSASIWNGLLRPEGDRKGLGAFVWRHAFGASTDRPADRETKKAPGVPGLQGHFHETSRNQGALDRPILSQGTNHARRGSKHRSVKRKVHRPHTEALGSSAQMRCVSC
jgi:hypothetical protein